ncbi:hypothetical protein OHC33_007746 [Knufia fluminis]|uniref:Uncharacterized protein n=1 Tax=Knufia fluminis TaxID=191047 RepID=A0AAN8ESN4_9EURO|nr:hypothetical protein OHC33_007746 [Knufia fluminis]
MALPTLIILTIVVPFHAYQALAQNLMECQPLPVVTEYVQQVVVSCPCDGSASTTLLRDDTAQRLPIASGLPDLNFFIGNHSQDASASGLTSTSTTFISSSSSSPSLSAALPAATNNEDLNAANGASGTSSISSNDGAFYAANIGPQTSSFQTSTISGSGTTVVSTFSSSSSLSTTTRISSTDLDVDTSRGLATSMSSSSEPTTSNNAPSLFTQPLKTTSSPTSSNSSTSTNTPDPDEDSGTVGIFNEGPITDDSSASTDDADEDGGPIGIFSFGPDADSSDGDADSNPDDDAPDSSSSSSATSQVTDTNSTSTIASQTPPTNSSTSITAPQTSTTGEDDVPINVLNIPSEAPPYVITTNNSSSTTSQLSSTSTTLLDPQVLLVTQTETVTVTKDGETMTMISTYTLDVTVYLAGATSSSSASSTELTTTSSGLSSTTSSETTSGGTSSTESTTTTSDISTRSTTSSTTSTTIPTTTTSASTTTTSTPTPNPPSTSPCNLISNPSFESLSDHISATDFTAGSWTFSGQASVGKNRDPDSFEATEATRFGDVLAFFTSLNNTTPASISQSLSLPAPDSSTTSATYYKLTYNLGVLRFRDNDMCIFEVFFNDLKIDGEVIGADSVGVLRGHSVEFTPTTSTDESGSGDGTLSFSLRCPFIGASVGREVMDGIVVLDMVGLRSVDQLGCDV